jgi:hypothetical protein
VFGRETTKADDVRPIQHSAIEAIIPLGDSGLIARLDTIDLELRYPTSKMEHLLSQRVVLWGSISVGGPQGLCADCAFDKESMVEFNVVFSPVDL